MKYIFHIDPGHGWFEVTRAELIRLGILNRISHYSYQKDDKVYLEEDCDATTFIQAKQALGEDVTFDEQYLEKPIRHYPMFNPSGENVRDSFLGI